MVRASRLRTHTMVASLRKGGTSLARDNREVANRKEPRSPHRLLCTQLLCSLPYYYSGPALATTFGNELQLANCVNTYVPRGAGPFWGQLGCSGFIILDGELNVRQPSSVRDGNLHSFPSPPPQKRRETCKSFSRHFRRIADLPNYGHADCTGCLPRNACVYASAGEGVRARRDVARCVDRINGWVASEASKVGQRPRSSGSGSRERGRLLRIGGWLR